jgi:hypothetical protein
MRLDKTRAVMKRLKDSDSGYASASPVDRVSFVWEITREVWALKGDQGAERGLQRTVVNLIRRQG